MDSWHPSRRNFAHLQPLSIYAIHSTMRKVAEDMFLLNGLPPNVMNVYTFGGVLLDAGRRSAERRNMHGQGRLNAR